MKRQTKTGLPESASREAETPPNGAIIRRPAGSRDSSSRKRKAGESSRPAGSHASAVGPSSRVEGMITPAAGAGCRAAAGSDVRSDSAAKADDSSLLGRLPCCLFRPAVFNEGTCGLRTGRFLRGL